MGKCETRVKAHLEATPTSGNMNPVLWPSTAIYRHQAPRIDPAILEELNAQQREGAKRNNKNKNPKQKTRGKPTARLRSKASNNGGRGNKATPAKAQTPFQTVTAQLGASRGNSAELILPPFNALEQFDSSGDVSTHERAYEKISDGRTVELLPKNLPPGICKIKIGAHRKKDYRFYAIADDKGRFIVVGYYGSHKNQLTEDAMRKKFATLNKAYRQGRKPTETQTYRP